MRPTAGLLASTVLTSLLVVASAASPATSAETSPPATSTAAAAAAGGKPVAGACYDLTAEQLSKRTSGVDPVPCKRTHTVVTAGVPNLPPHLSYLSAESAIAGGSVQACATPFARVVGGTFTQRAQARYFLSYFRPTQAQIRAGARWVRCDVVLLQGAGVGPLPVTRKPFLRGGVTGQVRRCGTRSLTYVPCNGGHGFRAAGAFRVARKQYPTKQEYQDLINRGCRPYLGRSPGYATIRERDTWDTGDRTITCFKQTKS